MYNLVIHIYRLIVHLVAPFHRKAGQMVRGHREVFDRLKREVKPGEEYVWFHAASLGEFEQGRPLLEKIRQIYPHYKIVQTFFSPSGYEVRKNYQGADIVCYLPFDTPRNAKRLVRLLRPKAAFFIKYEFWKNYIAALHRQGIPVFSVSSIFRDSQIFFRPYGRSYAKVLDLFSHFFVQDVHSIRLLDRLGLHNVTLSGDTRFDRVLEVREHAEPIPVVERFCGNDFVIVGGSTWQPDEEILIEYFNAHPDTKLILAPHVVSESHIAEIVQRLKRPYLRFSTADLQQMDRAECLIIDTYGLLSSVYRYGTIAYIGGGFGVGIHNILEAAVYGLPILFGPNYHKFLEAEQLLEAHGGCSINSAQEFTQYVDLLRADADVLQQTGHAAMQYVNAHSGALDKIIHYLNVNHVLS